MDLLGTWPRVLLLLWLLYLELVGTGFLGLKIRNFITEWYIILKRKTEVCLPCFCHFLSGILQIKIYDIVQAGLKLKTLLKAGATDKGPCAHLWLFSLQVHFMTAVHYLKPCTSMAEFQRRAESKDVLLLSVSV